MRGSPERDMLLLGAGGEGGGSGQTRVRHAPPPPPQRADFGDFGPLAQACPHPKMFFFREVGLQKAPERPRHVFDG